MRFLVVTLLFLMNSASAQDQTVGVFTNDSLAFNGYTLLFPSTSRETYLIDNCGYVINKWRSENTPGLSAYLLEDGTLLRTGRIFTSFLAGGNGGHIEKRSWNDTLIWEYNYANDEYSQHHDIEPLPNGNILILSWERVPTEQVIAAGRNPESITSSGVWFEKVVEVKPLGSNDIEIIWQWRLWDHLVQDYDSTLLNFGAIDEHPERLDINYNTFINNNPGGPDWVHFNSVAYNLELDQIMLSSRNFSEIYIIDHSTNPFEAAGSSGGNSGKGGDFLYRWGNPIVYGRGDAEDQKLFGQHDAHWISHGSPDAGKIIIFNNGEDRPDNDHSSVEIIEAPMLNDGNYSIEASLPYGPASSFYSFQGEGNASFYSRRVSGADQLPNGNLLICVGNDYRIFEVNDQGEVLWDYINPVSNAGPIAQGNSNSNRDLFRAYKYAVDYPAFDGKNMEPGERIEVNPIEDDCQIYQPTSATSQEMLSQITISPNPTDGQVYLHGINNHNFRISVFDINGRFLRQAQNKNLNMIDLSDLDSGIYFLHFLAAHSSGPRVFKIVKCD